MNVTNTLQPETIFGPVPSRRLGRSLGVDLVPFKTCPYDCIYCQLGRTTCKTIERREYVSLAAVLEQLKAKLDTKPDVITLSGSGEPTLYSRIEALISGIKRMTDIPVVVLTNGALLCRLDVQQGLAQADIVIPSLDAGRADSYQYINRPHKSLTYESLIEGLIQFRKVYQGQYWLEVMLLEGVTTTQKQIEVMAEIIRSIDPDRVQINTVTRPPAEGFAERVEQNKLEKLANRLHAEAEVIADYRRIHTEGEFVICQADILALLKRRPCSVADIASGLNLHRNHVIKSVQSLVTQRQIKGVLRHDTVFYQIDKNGAKT
ncbi:MAG: radical SAM protein [Phycisphaerae bacterium]|nr:radical SAM protein [Phycisphaerae bacterium]